MMSKSLGFLLVLTGSFMNAEHVLPSNRSLFPLNFIESSIALNQKLQFTEYLKNNAPIDIEYDPRDQNEWIKNILIDLHLYYSLNYLFYYVNTIILLKT